MAINFPISPVLDDTFTDGNGTSWICVNATGPIWDQNDTSILQAEVDLNTAKVTNVDHPIVETAVPTGAVFTDTTNHTSLSNIGTNTHAQIDSSLSTLDSDKLDVTNPEVTGTIIEDVYDFGTTSGTKALDPSNGSMQTINMSGTTTFTDSFSAGEAITLRLAQGSSRTVNWPTTVWVGGSAPTLTALDIVVLWKDNVGLKGSYAGSLV